MLSGYFSRRLTYLVVGLGKGQMLDMGFYIGAKLGLTCAKWSKIG